MRDYLDNRQIKLSGHTPRRPLLLALLFCGLALLLLATDSLHRDIEDMRHLWVLLGMLAFAGRGAPQDIGELATALDEEEDEVEPEPA